MEATRERIIEAAIELYTEVGISKATMRQVGLRSDVAPGTLRRHFPSRRSLDEAMVERLTAEAPLPDASIYDGADSIDERVGRYVFATGRFFDQAGRIYRMWLRERMVTSPWLEAGATYGARWAELQRGALGPLADDEEVQAVLRAVLDPVFFDALRGSAIHEAPGDGRAPRSGPRSTEEVSALATRLIVAWLDSSTGPRA